VPTPSEQKALAFVAIAIVLGGAVRILRAGSPAVASPAEQQAIARQAYSADSASRQAPGPRSGRRSTRAARSLGDSATHAVGPPLSTLGYPPPTARIDVDNRLALGMAVRVPTAAIANPSRGATAAVPVDLDLAGRAELEALPRIGPALAARIVASRDSLGPFGSLEGLGRVRGIGPAMLRQLRPLVTFSGREASSDDRPRY
jgi:DNA uptake protein ComE-like DNA-binding protein